MVYELDGRPSLSTAVPLGLQHVLAMFVSGLTTFIQLYPLRLGSKYQVGARLPIVMGTSFTFVPTASAVGAAGGIGAVLGGCLAGSLVEVLINGIKMIAKAGFSERNILVMGLTFVFGIGVPAHPEAVAQLPGFIRFIFNDAVTATCIMAIIANVLFPMKDVEDIEKAKAAMMS